MNWNQRYLNIFLALAMIIGASLLMIFIAEEPAENEVSGASSEVNLTVVYIVLSILMAALYFAVNYFSKCYDGEVPKVVDNLLFGIVVIFGFPAIAVTFISNSTTVTEIKSVGQIRKLTFQAETFFESRTTMVETTKGFYIVAGYPPGRPGQEVEIRSNKKKDEFMCSAGEKDLLSCSKVIKSY